MAFTTSTTAASAIPAEEIVEYIQEASHNNLVMPTLFDVKEGGSSAVSSFPKVTALSAPATGDEGSTAITPQAFTLTSAEATAAPYELQVNVSKQALRLMPASAFMALVDEMIYQLNNKIETLACALFAGLDAGVGTSGTNIAPSDMNAAITAHNIAQPARAFRSVFALHPTQIGDLMDAPLDATNGLGKMMGNDQFMNLFGTNPNSAMFGAQAGTWGGVPVFRLAQVPTANGGADRCGGLFCFGQGGAFGMKLLWGAEIEQGSLISAYASGVTYLGDVSVGVIEVNGTMGQKITTDA